MEIRAIASRTRARAEHLAGRYGIRTVYEDHRRLVDDPAISVIDLCVPNALHLPLVLEAPKAGKHVICEKPLTGYFGQSEQDTKVGLTPKRAMLDKVRADLAEITRVMAEHPVKFCYAENWVYAPAVRKALEILDRYVTAGSILEIRGEESHSGSHSEYSKWWRYAGGGSLARLAAHPIGLGLFLKHFEGRKKTGRPIIAVEVLADGVDLTKSQAFASVKGSPIVTGWGDVETWAHEAAGRRDESPASQGRERMIGFGQGVVHMKPAFLRCALASALVVIAACGPSVRPDTTTHGDGGSNNTCQASQQRCVGAVLQTCQNGTFTDSQTCPQACDATLGCVVCVPNTGTCNGDVSIACKGDGSGYVDVYCDPVQGMSCGPAGICEVRLLARRPGRDLRRLRLLADHHRQHGVAAVRLRGRAAPASSVRTMNCLAWGHLIQWSPDEKKIALFCMDFEKSLNSVYVLDARTYETVLTIEKDLLLDPLQWISWSPDSTRIAVTGGNDETGSIINPIYVFDASSGKELLKIVKHTGQTFGVDWSPDGKRLVTGSTDDTTRIWDAPTGVELLTLSTPCDWWTVPSWSPDGFKYLIVPIGNISGPGRSCVWRVWQ